MKHDRMVRFRISSELYAELESIAEREGRSVADVIRRRLADRLTTAVAARNAETARAVVHRTGDSEPVGIASSGEKTPALAADVADAKAIKQRKPFLSNRQIANQFPGRENAVFRALEAVSE